MSILSKIAFPKQRLPPNAAISRSLPIPPPVATSQLWEQWSPFFLTRARLDTCLPDRVRALPKARFVTAVRTPLPPRPPTAAPVPAAFQSGYTMRDNDVCCSSLRDSLFWTYFMMKHGVLTYEQLQPIFLPTEKEHKYACVERLRHEKKLVSSFRLASLAHVENQLANESALDMASFLVLCQMERIPFLFVRRQLGYVSPALEDMCEDAPPSLLSMSTWVAAEPVTATFVMATARSPTRMPDVSVLPSTLLTTSTNHSAP
jgi:hypothetical protein